MSTVKVSKGNSKLGAIPSVSLPSIKTCRQCACQEKCYAQKLERLRPAVRNAYQHNLEVLSKEPETYWREVEASVMMSRFFRFHVSGDIPTAEYLANMVAVAVRNSHCEILCFTKRYEMVNEFIRSRTTESSHSSLKLAVEIPRIGSINDILQFCLTSKKLVHLILILIIFR